MPVKRRRDKGDGSIYFRRSDRRWIGDIKLNGKRKIVSAATKGEVAEKLVRVQRDAELGLVGDGTLGSFVMGWIGAPPSDITARTVIGYRGIITKHLVPRLGGTKLHELTAGDVRRMLEDMAREGFAPGTRRNVRACLSRLLAAAVDAGYIADNPAKAVQMRGVEASRRKWPEMDAVRARQVLDATRDTAIGDLTALALYTGLRLGELLALDWADVRLASKQLSVWRSLVMTEDGWEVVDRTKSGKQRRVPLADEAVRLLWSRYHKMGDPKRGWVFPSPKRPDRPPTPGWIGHKFRAILSEHEVPLYRFHDLRHACATLLIGKGVPIPTVSRLLGHSKPDTTWRVYAHALTELDRTGVENLRFWDGVKATK